MRTAQLRAWIDDALSRHERDVRERQESAENVTVDEIVDAVWGRLPLEVRRESSRAQVQASLTMLTLRHSFASNPPSPGAGDSAAEAIGDGTSDSVEPGQLR